MDAHGCKMMVALYAIAVRALDEKRILRSILARQMTMQSITLTLHGGGRLGKRKLDAIVKALEKMK